MQRFDRIALEMIYAPVAGWVRQRLGIEQWRLSLECLNGHLVFYLAGTALTIAQRKPGDAIYPVMLGALAWLLLMQAVRRMALRQAGSSLGVQTARMAEWHIRTILLAALPVIAISTHDLGAALYAIALALLASHFYFKACDTPPPQERHQRRLAYSRH
jgi:hypothetical protein